MVRHGSDQSSIGEGTSTVVDMVNQNIDDEETSHQEKHWGEILERTVSKSNLMLVNGTTHQKITSDHQNLPRKLSDQLSDIKSSISLNMEMK